MRLNATTVSYDPLSYSSLTPHDPISITSDSGFEVFPGSGTFEEPYVIEGYSIITTTDDNGIYINSTTRYFIVRNCYVDAVWNGIYIDNVADGTASVINNTCSNNGNKGIYLYYSNNSTVANNTCSKNRHGIYFQSSGSANVINNTCSKSHFHGIKLDNSGSANVINNTCNNSGDDIFFSYSDSSTVANNTFANCGLEIIENTLDAYISYTIENNWVNGKKLGFYTNLDSTIISEPVYGQLILVNCTNVTVRDQILNSAATGLCLYSCTHSVIINNMCCNNNGGISLYSSVNSTIANNTCSNNYWGIYLEVSNCSTVTNNTCNNNNREGIVLGYSDSSTVANNTCNNNNELGIYLWSSGSSAVINNMCSNNRWVGIYLSDSSSSTVANNTCSNNDNGILLHFSSSCIVIYNLLQENGGYGLYLRYDSDNTLVHHNNFVDNNLGGTSQAYDDCTNNFWYDTETSEGNYWSDYIGEGSYPIDGLSNSVDLYPLDEPVKFSTSETKMFFTFSLLIVIVPLLLLKLFSRKRLKTA